MDMRVTGRATAAPGEGIQPNRKRLEIKPDSESIADRYSSSRSLGNYMSGAAVGAATETAAAVVQSPRLAWEIVENLWQAETLGPNLKILGTLAALPAAVLSIPVAPLAGIVHGLGAVRHQRHAAETALTPDTSAGVARQLTSREAGEGPRTMTGSAIDSLESLGSQKLAEGEKPHDVPLLSPLFSVVSGAVSGVISGCVGLVSGLVAGAITGAKEIGGAFTAKDKGLGARVGTIVAAPLNLVAGPALAWKSLKEAVPRGLVDGWNHGPIRPVVDTARIAASLGGGVIHEAWEK